MQNDQQQPRGTVVPEFPEDFGVFISSDGANSSVPWILGDHGTAGVFTEAAIGQILESCRPTFTLTAEDLRGLSRCLGSTLNPETLPLLAGVSRSHAHNLGRQQVAETTKHILKAENEARSAVAALKHLAARAFTEYGRLDLSAIESQLAMAADLLRDAAQDVNAKESAATISMPRFENSRHVPDLRRRLVVMHARRFLQETGNRYGFTTDTANYSRGGGLMEFLDIIVSHLTDPPSKLSPNTVSKDVKALKNLKKDLCTEG